MIVGECSPPRIVPSLQLADGGSYFEGMGDDPSVGEYEHLLLAKKTSARKELVLLHPDKSVPPGSTRPWLKVGSLFVFSENNAAKS